MARKPDRSPSAEVYSITAAHRPHAEEMRERMTKYAVSMTIRTACFVLLVVVHGPARWLFAVAAVVLPYIAVIVANAGRERTTTPTTLIGRGEHPALSTAAPPAPQRPAPQPREQTRQQARQHAPQPGPATSGARPWVPAEAPASGASAAPPSVIRIPEPPTPHAA